MKKTLLLAAALVMSVCSWAQVNLTSGVYEIENVSDEGGSGIGRGYLVDYTGYKNGPSIGDCPWTTHRANHPEQKNGDTTCSYWYLYNAEGTYYIFSLSTLGDNTAPKFLKVGTPSNNNNVKLATWASDKVALEIVENTNKAGSVAIRNVGVTASNGYLSMACGTNSNSGAVKVDALTDGGCKLKFNAVDANQLTTAQTTLMNAGIAICSATPSEPYKFVSEIEDGKTYVLINQQPQGYPNYLLHTDNGVVTAQNATGMGADTEWAEADQYVAHLQSNGKYVFQNVSTDAYLAWKGTSGGVNNNSGFDTQIAEHTSWTVTKGTRFENTFYLSASKRAPNNNTSGVLIIGNNGAWNSWTSGENTSNAAYSNNFGFVLVDGEAGPEPEKTTLSVTLLNGSEEISLSAESATSVATATGIKFAFANVSNESVGYAYAIYQGEEQEPIYAGGAEYSIDSDDFDQTIHFAKDEQYKVVVSCLFDGPEFTYTITGTYEEEGDPTGETKPVYTIESARPNGFFAYNDQLCTAEYAAYAEHKTEENSKWLKIPTKEETGFFFYNVGTKQFMGQSTDNVKIPMSSEATTIYYVWENNQNNGDYGFSIGTAATKNAGKILNASCWNNGTDFGARLANGSSCNYDAGNELKFVEVATISATEFDAIKKAAWNSYYAPIELPFTLSDEENTYCYTIKNPGTKGTVYVKVVEDGSIRFTINQEEADKFAFYQGAEEGDGTAYVYDVTAGKYFTWTEDREAGVNWSANPPVLNGKYVEAVDTKAEAHPWAFVAESEGVYDVLPNATSNNGWNFCGGIDRDFAVLNLYKKNDNDSKWVFEVANNDEEATLTVVNNGDNTITVTPSDLTALWYVTFVPTSTLEGLNEEEQSYALGGLFWEAVADITSEQDAYVGEQTVTPTGLSEGSYKAVVGYVKYDSELLMSYIPAGSPESYDFVVRSTTGISAVAPVVAGKAIFNLQGQRIQKLQKGINIVGGQKVVR